MPDELRTFLAIQVPDEIRDFSRRFQESLCEYGIVGKWVAPQNLHVTTLFLGDQTESQLATVRDIARRITSDTPVFELECAGIGSFKTTPALLYLSLAPDPPRAFVELALTIRSKLAANHVRLPRNVFLQDPTPHLTLVRFRHGGEARRMRRLGHLRDTMWTWSKPIPELPNITFPVDSIQLLASTLTPQGPIYETIESFPLPA